LAQHDLSEELYANVADFADYPGYTAAERAALDYTTRFCIDHLSIDQALMDELRGHFGDELLFDLTLCVAGWLALGRVTQVMGVEVSCPLVL
jgi:alkylhydroperoxidase family enzyme